MDLKALYRIQYGMYIVGAHKAGKLNGQIANTVFQITSEPPTLAVSINKKNLTHEYIEAGQAFSAAVLFQDTSLSFIGQFGFKSGRDVNKLAGINHKIGVTGCPIVLDNAIAFIECQLVQKVDAGTHTIFIGQIVDAQILAEKPGMTYEYYQQVKRGTTPKTAPSYVNLNQPSAPVVSKAAKYKCDVCGYIYDPEKGDPDSGVKPGTPFEALPEGWVCSVCGADKNSFHKIVE